MEIHALKSHLNQGVKSVSIQLTVEINYEADGATLEFFEMAQRTGEILPPGSHLACLVRLAMPAHPELSTAGTPTGNLSWLS